MRDVNNIILLASAATSLIIALVFALALDSWALGIAIGIAVLALCIIALFFIRLVEYILLLTEIKKETENIEEYNPR